MTGLPLLSLLIALPLIAGLVCLFVSAKAARWIALGATLACLVIGIDLWLLYDPDGAQWQFVERLELGGGLSWALGIDGIALMLIMLSVFLMPICIGASWQAIDRRVPE
ncbi:MAG: NADH-quinone oxidoreductase subunit M, partial [Sphingomonas sp.]|nr:NADH-quinone oxidoreductase subunit M [Sphingomonas sp.]